MAVGMPADPGSSTPVEIGSERDLRTTRGTSTAHTCLTPAKRNPSETPRQVATQGLLVLPKLQYGKRSFHAAQFMPPSVEARTPLSVAAKRSEPTGSRAFTLVEVRP